MGGGVGKARPFSFSRFSSSSWYCFLGFLSAKQGRTRGSLFLFCSKIGALPPLHVAMEPDNVTTGFCSKRKWISRVSPKCWVRGRPLFLGGLNGKPKTADTAMGQKPVPHVNISIPTNID